MPSADALQTELWTSWASLLRSYAAAHGLNAPQHAIIEVGRDIITLRVGARWLRFTRDRVDAADLPPQPFQLNDNGTVTLAGEPAEEMDIAAERFTRHLLISASDPSNGQMHFTARQRITVV